MTLRTGVIFSAVGMWVTLMGCATPSDETEASTKDFIERSVASLVGIEDRPEPSVARLKELGIVYERRGPGGECGADPYIHGPQDRCHPQHRLYGQIRDRLADVLARGGEQLSAGDAERVALATFWCATYSKLARVDEIDVWPATGPWRKRLITMTQRGSMATGEGDEQRAQAAFTGLAIKHNSLIQMIRWTDHGTTIDRWPEPR